MNLFPRICCIAVLLVGGLGGFAEEKTSSILRIDRLTPVDIRKFGNLPDDCVIDEQDKRSLDLWQIDVEKLKSTDALLGNEERISGEERLQRLKKRKFICLDAKILETLLDTPSLIPESWKGKRQQGIMMFFEGTVFRDPDGIRWVLYLMWDKRTQEWICQCVPTNTSFSESFRSIVLPPRPLPREYNQCLPQKEK